MLRFRVHDPKGPDGSGASGAWSLRSAYLVGPDGRPAPGTVTVDGGVISCEPEREQPVGLALLVDTGAAGRIVLQTCFLPAKNEPYELFIEIARWLIKQFVLQSETWQMWNPLLSGEALHQWEIAREAFRAALRESEPVAGERLAREAVAVGVAAAERLAERHSHFLLVRRFARKGLGVGSTGLCVDPSIAPKGAATAVASRVGVIALRTPWTRIEARPGKRDFAAIDAWVQWAHAERKPIVLGPVVDFGPDEHGKGVGIPAHVMAEHRDPKRFRELIWHHAHAVATRYAAVTPFFITASGANLAVWRRDGIERMLELCRTATAAVRDVRRDAKAILEIQSPGAEHWCGVHGAAWPTSFLQRAVGENLGFFAAGVRFVLAQGQDPIREFLTVADLLDGYLGRDLPVFVSGFGVPSEGDGGDGGCWHGAWTPGSQARWGGEMLQISLARKWIEGAWWSRLQDTAHSTDGLLDVHGRPKPVLESILNLRNRLEHGDARGTDPDDDVHGASPAAAKPRPGGGGSG
ncbi:MAG: hypothetical protein ACO31E_07620 [Phycisphaerales bacterium]